MFTVGMSTAQLARTTSQAVAARRHGTASERRQRSSTDLDWHGDAAQHLNDDDATRYPNDGDAVQHPDDGDEDDCSAQRRPPDPA